MSHNIKFDEKNNRVIIPADYFDVKTDEVYVPPHLLRKVLPLPASPQAKLDELEQMLHEIRKERLVNIRTYIIQLNKLAEGEEEARNKLKDAESNLDVKRWSAIAKTWMNEKNILREIRYAIQLLKKEEDYINELRAKVEAGIV